MKHLSRFLLRAGFAAFALTSTLLTFADLEDVPTLDNSKNLGCGAYPNAPIRSFNIGSDPYSYNISFSQGKFTIAFSNYSTCECAYSLNIKRDGHTLWIETVRDCSMVDENTPMVDCLCFTDYEASIDGLEEGSYVFVMPNGIYFADLTEGLSTVLSDHYTGIFTAREDAEWVFYNPGADINHEPVFIRSRMKNWRTRDNYDPYDIYTCIGDYDEEKAVSYSSCNDTSDFDLYINQPVLPSILFGYNNTWGETLEHGLTHQWMSLTSGPHYTKDICKQDGEYLKIKRVEPEIVDGIQTYRFTFENGLSFLGGVGFVGDTYANTLCGTSVDLPKGTVPTHFLYMRSLTDNHIIYGDPTLDPSYQGASAGEVKTDDAWVDTAEAFGIRAAGEATVTVYALNGQCVAAQTGRDEVLIPRSQLDAGIYLVRCSAPGHLLTRKLTLP